MSYISKIDPETAGEKEKEVIRDHLAQGYRLTNEKLTLLHNAEAFKAIEDSSYTCLLYTSYPKNISASCVYYPYRAAGSHLHHRDVYKRQPYYSHLFQL